MFKKSNLLVLTILSISLLFMPQRSLSMGKREYNNPALIGGNFSLVDQNENVITNDIFKNKYTMVFFGFSRCPHICPNHLSMMTKSLDKFPNLQALFITLDPINDTTHKLQEFKKSFHDKITMLTGAKEMTEKLISDYKVYVEANDDPEKFNHSAIIYLMGKNGRYLTHFTPADEDELYEGIRSYIN